MLPGKGIWGIVFICLRPPPLLGFLSWVVEQFCRFTFFFEGGKERVGDDSESVGGCTIFCTVQEGRKGDIG